MSLFRCSKCGCVENTALSRFWVREGTPALCSECDPQIGKWHGHFEKRQPGSGAVEDEGGFLQDPWKEGR